MKKTNVFYWILLVFFFVFFGKVYSQEEMQELIINGNMGNFAGTNFDYKNGGYISFDDPFSITSVPGMSANTNNPVNLNFDFLPTMEHTFGMRYSGTMLVVDGGNLGNTQYFWKGGYGGNGFCGLTIGKKYTFSYWVHSVSSLVVNSATQADIRIDFSNVSDIILVSGNKLAPLPSEGWQKVTYSFIATDYCVNINLWDANTNSVGNDFALDDFSLQEEVPLGITYSLSYASDGIRLFAYSMSGSPYIRSWTLTGPVNRSGWENFKNLIPGNYQLTAVDVNGQTANCDVVIPFDSNYLQIKGNANICQGESTVLSVTGGNSIYEWFSNPTDTNIADSSKATQILSPSVTTNYTVKSRPFPGTENLVFNGDFSLGNIGFDTYYKYYSTNFENAPRTYNVGNSPSSWSSILPNCGDHTSGNGNMLMVNGYNGYSSASRGSVPFWKQSIKVNGTTNYVFSFWVHSFSEINPAEINVTFNGSFAKVYFLELSPTKVCGNWIQFSVNYFSGWLNEWVNIEILNSGSYTDVGNDFAIDDISFVAVNPIDIYSNFTVTVAPPEKPILANSVITQNEIQFNWNQVPNATDYELSYSVNGANTIDIGSITTNTYKVEGLSPGDLVKLIVKPIGNGCFDSVEFSKSTYLPCPVPEIMVNRQPTCNIPLGSIKVTSPVGSEYEYSLNGINFQSDVLFDNVNTGNKTITVRNTVTNCQSVSNTVVLNAPDAVLPNISVSYSYQDCLVNLVATSTTLNHSIVWNGPSLTIDTPNPAEVSVSGTFTATVKDLNTGCTKSIDLNVLQPILPPKPVVSSIDPTCTNDYGQIMVISPIDSNYEYSIDGVNFQSIGQFSNLYPANYSVFVKDKVTSCVSVPTEIILKKPIIEVPQVVLNNDNLCQNSVSGPLSVIASPNAILNWYGENETGGIASNVPTIPSTVNIGRTVYYVSQSIGNCESARVPIPIDVSGEGISPGFSDLSFCAGEIIAPLSNVSPNGIVGNWNSSIIDNSKSKSYLFTPNPNQCAIEQKINITINVPTLKYVKWETSKAFDDSQSIEIQVFDQGEYLYQLDDGLFQESPLFENVKHGYHSVKVIDVNGCSEPVVVSGILVVNFPNYFTPNGDGYNDFWNISDLKNYDNSSVFIYDRYGKLLKELFPSKDFGWDGTYLGKEMPASDYWFVVFYYDNGEKKEYKGHFSLKR